MLLQLPVLLLAAPVLAQFVEFENSQVSLNDSQASALLKFRLKSRPSSNLNVYISGPGLIFSSCRFTFTPYDYDTYQTLGLRATPIFANPSSPSGSKVVSFRIFNSTAVTQSLTIPHYVARGYSCSSTGDPHLSTFDDSRVELQKPYPIHLFRSDELNIQAIQGPCGHPMCNYGVAVRYGRSTFIWDFRGRTPSTYPVLTRGRNSLNEDKVFVLAKNGHLTITLPDRSVISVSPQHWSGYYLGNIVLSLSARQLSKGSYGGVCNRPEGAKSKFYGRYSATHWPVSPTNALVFASSWIVLDHENLFKNATRDYRIADEVASLTCNAITSEAQHQDPQRIVVQNVPLLPQDVPVYNSTYIRPETESKYPFPAGSQQLLFAKEAEIYCKSQFEDAACVALVDPYPYIESCILDALISGDHGFSRGHKHSFLENCAQVAESLILSSNSADQERGRAAIYSAGIGAAPCTKSCETNGVCTEFGCLCNSGWYGMYCEHNAANHTRLVNGTWEQIYQVNATAVRKCGSRNRFY